MERIKTYSVSDQQFCISVYICRTEDFKNISSTGKVSLLIFLINPKLVVSVLIVVVFVCFVSFRSRSYPVPQRGERVKQRTVHARN
jgi:hypothetical protein